MRAVRGQRRALDAGIPPAIAAHYVGAMTDEQLTGAVESLVSSGVGGGVAPARGKVLAIALIGPGRAVRRDRPSRRPRAAAPPPLGGRTDKALAVPNRHCGAQEKLRGKEIFLVHEKVLTVGRELLGAFVRSKCTRRGVLRRDQVLPCGGGPVLLERYEHL